MRTETEGGEDMMDSVLEDVDVLEEINRSDVNVKKEENEGMQSHPDLEPTKGKHETCIVKISH
jgi:glutamine amidotransferase PdxT